jgi:hypothetical protein
MEAGSVKTTLEIPDELLRQARVIAALRGESLKDFVTAALRAQLDSRPAEDASPSSGWRMVFGRAEAREVAEIDRIIAEELEHIEPGRY